MRALKIVLQKKNVNISEKSLLFKARRKTPDNCVARALIFLQFSQIFFLDGLKSAIRAKQVLGNALPLNFLFSSEQILGWNFAGWV